MEEQLLSALREAGPNGLHEQRAMLVLYCHRDHVPNRGALYALICHIRRKLAEAPTGIVIETSRYRG